MSTATATAPETQQLGLAGNAPAGPPPIIVTEKAAAEVKRHIASMIESKEMEPDGKLYLRVRVQGGGCSGFQNKLDLDAKYDEKTDHKFDFHGVEVVVDKRSMLYLSGATVDFHDDLNKRGFTINNPQAKSTCGCGSSYTM
ncbi:Iron-sulfur cluster insertion protein ErpA [Gemmata obscuriglobus]|uniref:Iron-sulfur cluster assembly accessory protein n=1 Tax=Gemmata obscuriglobus TaxID=114 RepID=A0A2Z3H7E6_9BACT|nr:iron-sulfur cluster assembly accessory protein [Gemmata obscuriglobus]AWM38895.1 iron-sulfur cluster assembly accessory protein [Gemmata obscuriglobus]QEG28103.1 Iron-sulfur cluster insertion protein ErpA [Gemmata obscuriglobus]VTS05739.1 iron-sulfur cluster assembly accessory protein : FeS cluster insertion OS=Rhodopirellula sallentina SM41 GN=RSSM_04857 PE=4 SV=1: Fe-S_biosyn [Gemmata obscuriglobus UQM 2246]